MFPRTWKYETDLLVIGASIGGLVASLRALRGGVRVILTEAGRETGGTALLSGGYVHSRNMGSWELAKKAYPDMANNDLARLFIETWAEASRYVTDELGAPHTRWNERWTVNTGPLTESLPPSKVDFGMGPLADCSQYESKRNFCDFFDQKIRDAGGTILLGTKGFRLWQDDDSATKIVGARCLAADEAVDIKAKAVLLSCGGFQASPEMMVRYFGEWADNTLCRAVPYNDGAGIRMAEEVGAKLTKGMASTYGHTVPALPYSISLSYEDIQSGRAVKQYETVDKNVFISRMARSLQAHDFISICVNLNGERYVDEGFGGDRAFYTNVVSEAVLRQPYALGFYIFDSQRLGDAMLRLHKGLIEECGTTIVSAPSIDELADQWNNRDSTWPHKIHKTNLLRTVHNFNEAARAGDSSLRLLSPPRTGFPIPPLEKPPFYLIPFTGGISMTYGGVAIDRGARVMGPNDVPLRSLYAIPGTAGGVMYKGFLGANACLVTFGYIAAGTIAKEITNSR